ncbi:twin-arginine translocation signal domain-containing protein [Campylobacter concisus]|uniref:twin-arginine translocation signal domain-containing protein n=1 Tax=Campylobacter concisus TaxID=199 RepID=UPI001F3D3E3E|nr:twin-arginine translocation signal domain-containing protein [Campylobacter concisus]
MELKQTGISRRGFLKGALATAAVATPQTMLAGFTPFKFGRVEACLKLLMS